MKKQIAHIICAASLLSGMQAVLAESVTVKGNAIFILDNSVAGSQIMVKSLANGTANTCLSDASLNLLGLETGTTATDILIKNNTAVITTYNNTSTVTDVKLVSVASCITDAPGTETPDISECYASLEGSTLHIPCFKLNDEIISVELGQRGNSMNFEYESHKPGKGHHKGGDDND